jgi:hypothetical protein
MANKRMALITRVMMIIRFRVEFERLLNGGTHRILTPDVMLKLIWWHIFSERLTAGKNFTQTHHPCTGPMSKLV